MNEDPRIPSPTTLVIAKHLPALIEIEQACAAAGLNAESLICAGLIVSLADLVTSDTAPGTPMHQDAVAAAHAAFEGVP